MSKSPASPTLKNIDLNEDWLSHPAVEWLVSRKKIFLWCFLGFLVVLIAAYRIAAARTLNAESDFFQAQAAFNQFQEASVDSEGSIAATDLEQLNAIMQRHPEIKPKYQGPLAQTLLVAQQAPQAQKYADDIFKRTQPEHLQLYQDYSQTSLLIGEGRYADAVTQAVQLKDKMDQLNASENSLLYVYNLIRLALLYQQTGKAQEELDTWGELQTQAQRLEAVLAVNQIFKIGQASLNQYIEARENTLK